MSKCPIGIDYNCDECRLCNGELRNHNPTNADRIRSMTNEELAVLLHNICPFTECDEPKLSISWDKDYEIGDNIHDIMEWLQQPAE